MALQVVAYDHDGMARNVDGLLNRHQNLRFRTGLPGGFLDCTFEIPGLDTLPPWLSEGDTIRIMGGNNCVFDGMIEDTRRVVGPRGSSLGVTALGWYRNLMTRVYTGAFTASESDHIIKSALRASCPLISHNYEDIEDAGQNLGSVSWTNEWVAQVVEDLRKLGDDQTPPRQWHFAVWDRVVYIYSTITDVTEQVGANADDAYSYNDGGTYNESADFLYIGRAAGSQIYSGLRFQTVAIPQGETINTCKLQVYAYADLNAVQTLIYCEDIDDAPTFSSGNNPEDRTLTTANATWDFTLADPGDFEDSADFASVLQEVIDRPGWKSGNDVVVIVKGDLGADLVTRIFSNDEGNSKQAKLVVNWGEAYDEFLAKPAFWPEDRDDWEYEMYAREIEGGATLTRTTDGLVNAVKAKYDSTYMAWATDTDSQADYFRRDDVLDVGSVSAAVAAIGRDMWLESRKDLRRKAGSIQLRGHVRRRWSGAPVHVSRVRAGERIRVLDLDYGDAYTMYIAQTDYQDAEDPRDATVSLTPEAVPDRVSMLLAKL